MVLRQHTLAQIVRSYNRTIQCDRGYIRTRVFTFSRRGFPCAAESFRHTRGTLIDFSGCTINTLARVVFRASWSASPPDILRELHWLPIRQIQVGAVTFKAKHSGLPAYLHDDLLDYQPTRMLRSCTAHLLQRPLVLTSVAARAFTVAAPTHYCVELTLCKHSIC